MPLHAPCPRRLPAVLLAGCLSIPMADAAPAADEAKSRALLSHEALTSARDDFRREDRAGRLGEADREDYRRYIEDLTRDLRRHCAAFAHAGGDPTSLGDVCPSRTRTQTRSTNSNAAPEKTREERIAAADAELRAAMGEFDEMLLREQERVKSAAPGSRESEDEFTGGGHGDGRQGERSDHARTKTPGETTESPPSDSAKTGGRNRGDSSGPPPSQGNGGRGEKGGGPKGTPGDRPDDVGDGSDDDIVAKQLREAAEKETDPELRKRLWKEYRQYKQSL